MNSKVGAQQEFALARELFERLTPDAFREAVALTEAAAKAGLPEAMCQIATLDAVGAGRARDFASAFSMLREASRAGSDHAAAQLSLLGAEPSPDLSRLLSVPQSVALSESPRIRHIPGFAPAAVCDWIMGRIRSKLAPALIWDHERDAGTADPVRSNSAAELRLTDMDVTLAVLRARMSIATRLPESIFETPQAMHYSVGQQFRPHHDYLDPRVPGEAIDIERRGQRIATFLLYLNDDYEGGETDFPEAGIRFRGNKGDALFFSNVTRGGAPDPRSCHAGRPPTSGDKWILSQWIRDRAPVAAQRSS